MLWLYQRHALKAFRASVKNCRFLLRSGPKVAHALSLWLFSGGHPTLPPLLLLVAVLFVHSNSIYSEYCQEPGDL